MGLSRALYNYGATRATQKDTRSQAKSRPHLVLSLHMIYIYIYNVYIYKWHVCSGSYKGKEISRVAGIELGKGEGAGGRKNARFCLFALGFEAVRPINFSFSIVAQPHQHSASVSGVVPKLDIMHPL